MSAWPPRLFKWTGSRDWGIPRGLGQLVLMIGVLLGAAGCTDGREGGVDAFPDAPLIEAVEVWAAGGVEEEGGLVVASSGRPFAAISRDLNVLFVEPQAPGVILLTPQGEVRSGIGREGEGPGEFQRLTAGGFVDDSGVWIYDSGLARATVYDRDGAVLSTRRVAAEELPGTPWRVHPWMLLEGGGFLGRPVYSGASGSAAGVPAPIAVWDHAGTLKVAGLTEPTAVPRAQIRTSAGVQLEVPNPIEADPILGASADGNWVFALDRTPAASERGVIGVRRFDPDGKLLAEVEIPYQPLAIPADTREGLLAAIRAWAERMSTAAPQLGPISADEAIREVRIPDYFPPVHEAHADDEGFWLRREMGMEGRWERYSLEGELLARVDVAAAVLAASREHFLTFRLDSLGVPVLTLLHLPIPRRE